jgi:hypothetical protein
MSVAAQLDELRRLRARVAAAGQPDEGMRGTAADAAKRRAAMDPATVRAAIGRMSHARETGASSDTNP